MAAKPETLNRFLFNSDYPTDKVVWLYEGETTSPSQGGGARYVNIDITSTIGTTVPIFIKGVYTIDNWQTAYMIGSDEVTTDSSKNVTTGLSWSTWGSPHLELSVYANTDYSVNLPVKYRLWGVMREDVNSGVEFSKNSGITKNKLIFDSRANYPRLYKDGIAKSGDVVTHELKKIPYVDYWWNWSADGFNSSWSYRPSGRLGDGTSSAPTVRITDSQLTFTQYAGEDCYYYYRIYA